MGNKSWLLENIGAGDWGLEWRTGLGEAGFAIANEEGKLSPCHQITVSRRGLGVGKRKTLPSDISNGRVY